MSAEPTPADRARVARAARPRAAGPVHDRRPRRDRRSGRHPERAVPRRRHADADPVLADRARAGSGGSGSSRPPAASTPPRPPSTPPSWPPPTPATPPSATPTIPDRPRRAATVAAASAAPGPASSACTPTGPGTSPAATIRSGAGSPSASTAGDEHRSTACTSSVERRHDRRHAAERQPRPRSRGGPTTSPSAWLAESRSARTRRISPTRSGAIDDHLDDVEREHPEFGELARDATRRLVRRRHDHVAGRLELGATTCRRRSPSIAAAAEEIFRLVATESAADRAHNPGLPSQHVDTIVATCCVVLSVMRRFHLDQVTLPTGRDAPARNERSGAAPVA